MEINACLALLYTARELAHQLADVKPKALVVLPRWLREAIAARDAGAVEQLVVANIKDYMPTRTKVLFTLFRERADGTPTERRLERFSLGTSRLNPFGGSGRLRI